MKRVLGLDLGDVRTGVAVSDELKMLAHPFETIENASPNKLLERVRQIVLEKDVDCVVVGLPRHMNGSYGVGAENARQFAEKLRPLIACEVVTWDERLSTVAAERVTPHNRIRSSIIA